MKKIKVVVKKTSGKAEAREEKKEMKAMKKMHGGGKKGKMC